MSELYVARTGGDQLIDALLHNNYGNDDGFVSPSGLTIEFSDPSGWDFSTGNPEFWRYADRLVRPGGTVLDIGMECGRSSFFFAAYGMHVLGIDTDAEALQIVDTMAARLKPTFDVDITTHVADALQEDLSTEAIDIVLLDHTLTHAPSKAGAFALIDKAYEAVKPGGHIWIRAVGKEDSYYEQLRSTALRGGEARIVDDNVIEHPCGCTGTPGIDPSLFFGQTDLLSYFLQRGATIVHSQTLPETGRRNIMYGEDYNREMPVDVSGMLTVLAQK